MSNEIPLECFYCDAYLDTHDDSYLGSDQHIYCTSQCFDSYYQDLLEEQRYRNHCAEILVKVTRYQSTDRIKDDRIKDDHCKVTKKVRFQLDLIQSLRFSKKKPPFEIEKR